VVIDEKLIARVMEITHAKSKREAIQIALEQIAKKSSFATALKKIKGQLEWSGDLNKMRRR
jgi:Arc/MetJ family transcription regulator